MLLIFVLVFLFALYIIIFIAPLTKGAPYVPTRVVNIDRLYKMLNIPTESFVADLGSGDGRVLIYFAQKGFRCDGYEINKNLYSLSKNKIKALGLEGKVNVYNKDFLKSDLSKYDFIFLFQVSYIIPKIEAQLTKQLKKGSIIASYCYKFKHLRLIKEANGWYIYQL